VAAPIGADFMIADLARAVPDVKGFHHAGSVTSVVIDPDRCSSPPPICPTTRQEVYVAGSAPGRNSANFHGGHSLLISRAPFLSHVFAGSEGSANGWKRPPGVSPTTKPASQCYGQRSGPAGRSFRAA